MNPKAGGILLLAAAILATSVGAVGGYYASHRSTFEFAVRYLPLFRWPEFLTGVLLGYVYKLSRTPKWIESHGDLFAAAGIILAAAVIVVVRGQSLFLHSGGLTIPFAIVILGLAEANGPIYRILSSRVAILLGEASYSLYILQMPVKFFAGDMWTVFAGDIPKPNWFRGLTFFAIIGFAVLINKLFENPARRAILKFARSGPARAGAASG
jgi:peptidoglycan/LPS O-acetylase OafA/YrhL